MSSQSQPFPAPERNTAPEESATVKTSAETSIPPQSESSIGPTDTSDISPQEGPLSSLAHKAAETQIGRAANNNIPESARPTLDRASRVLNTVDQHLLAAKDTLDTDEGRRLFKSACEFVSSLLAFLAMLFTTAVSAAERKLGMEPTVESSPKRFVKVCREASKRVRTCAETREKQVGGSCEAWIYAYARQAMDVMFSAFKSTLKGLSGFSGPGKEYVAPAADSIISVLPEDIQTDVRQSPGPVESLRSGLGLERSSATAEDCQPAPGATPLGRRMKAD